MEPAPLDPVGNPAWGIIVDLRHLLRLHPMTTTIPIWRVEGRPNDYTSLYPDFVPIKEFITRQSAEHNLNYWQSEFPFRDLFVFRVVEVQHPPKP